MFEFIMGALAASVLYFAFPQTAVWVNGKLARMWAALNAPRPQPPSDD